MASQFLFFFLKKQGCPVCVLTLVGKTSFFYIFGLPLGDTLPSRRHFSLKLNLHPDSPFQI